MTSSAGAAPLPRPALLLVTDSARLRGRRVEDLVREAVAGGVDVVQLREKDRSHSANVGLGARVRDAAGDGARFFVNGDIDCAFVLRAGGLHLPEDGASVADARARVGAGVLISRAVHSIDAAVQAERDGADMVQLGTVFETTSKPGRAPIGLDGVRAVCAAVRIPVIAIGGITAANAGGVIEAGAAGVAVIGAIFDADDPRVAAEQLRAAIDVAAGVQA
jgi:thiamine-phosphate pyrophosphorylase